MTRFKAGDLVSDGLAAGEVVGTNDGTVTFVGTYPTVLGNCVANEDNLVEVDEECLDAMRGRLKRRDARLIGPVSVEGKTVFLSGPMTEARDYGVGEFAVAHHRLKRLGAKCVYDPAVEYLREEGEPRDHETYMLTCLHELTRRDEEFSPIEFIANGSVTHEPFYDMLVRLPGWDNSDGAVAESQVAKAIGIEVRDMCEIDLDWGQR